MLAIARRPDRFATPLTAIVDAAALVFLIGLPGRRLRRDYARTRERPEDTRPLIARIVASSPRDPVYVYATGV
ncbi:MAG: hypothetical protein ACREOJ_10010, partial [Gemmatimonadaceae bacterium]